MIKCAEISNIDSLIIEVTENISAKNLKNFAINSLLLNDKKFNKNSCLYVNFIQEISSYQIFFTKEHYTFLIFEIFYLYCLNKDSNKETTLYLYSNFFCIYKNSNLYYFQKLEYTIDNDELKEYVKNKLKIEIDNFKIIEKDEIENLKINFIKEIKKSQLININKKHNYQFKIFLSYIFILFFGFYFYFSSNRNEELSSNIIDSNKQIQEIKNKYSYKSFENKFFSFLENIDKYKIQLKQFEYENKRIKTTITCEEKESIYQFLNEYKKSVLSNDINYLEDKKIFESILNASFNR